MSATSPTIEMEQPGATPFADVRAALRRLDLRRRSWRASQLAAYALAAAVMLLLLVSIADYVWPLPRALRILLVAPVYVLTLLYTSYAAWLLIKQPSLLSTARQIERSLKSRLNVLVTFAESAEAEGVSEQPSYIMARLHRQARTEVARIDASSVAPRRPALRALGALGLMLFILLALWLIAPKLFAREALRVLRLQADELHSSGAAGERPSAVSGADESVAVDELRVRIVPPSYSGLSVEYAAAGDAPLRVLAGSQVEVTLRALGTVDGAVLSFNGASNPMRVLAENRYSGAFTASASGAFEARVLADERIAPAPLVRAVEVYQDTVPEVRITEPVSDQLLRSVPTGPIGVSWTARDDLGLAGATLKYIKSRGEGDAAKFTSGEESLPGISQTNGREWNGGASLDLARLDVRAGDTFVFWIEARDRNPLAQSVGRSASLAIAIMGPEAVKLNLSDLRPNEIGRFLLSQRQIIIQTEKLHNERARLAQPELLRRANAIAADQREFKNAFNDYIKIEGAGEHAEPGATAVTPEQQAQEAADERIQPHDHGIPEPPAGSPSSVRDMIYAIRAMWDAEEALSTADTTKALAYEREALARLKRAQLAVRYVPPVAAQSKPLDLKRRYAGELAEIRTRLEKLARRATTKESREVRAALADAYSALNDLQSTLDVPATARSSALARAKESARAAADRLSVIGGDHASTIALATGQLRIVETELARTVASGTAEEFAARLSKPLALLAQTASNLYAIADTSTRASAGDAGPQLHTDDARSAAYYRRLAGGAR